jgi:DNA mismatch endonuclease (patch repair protein)
LDTLSSHERSVLMAKIKNSNTKPEVALRKYLFSIGYRYRINVSSITGSPDIVFPKYHALVFVHGCFWHQHGCSSYKLPKTNSSFWSNKFNKNKARDRNVLLSLLDEGWRVAIVWECSLTSTLLKKTGENVSLWMRSKKMRLEIPRPKNLNNSISK